MINIIDFVIFVKKLNGKKITLVVGASDTVKHVKDEIQDIEGIPPVQQKLLLTEKNLDDQYPLSYYNVQEEAILTLVYRLPPG